MGARTKLNEAHIAGAILLAIIAGMWFESWWGFWLVLLVCLADSSASGGIRGSRRGG